jgi:hypothetical protein
MRANTIPVVIIVQILLFAGGVFSYARPQPDFTLWGTVYVNGTALTREDTGYTVTLEVKGQGLVRYTMGENPAYGDHYVLKVPMDDEPAMKNKGQAGDVASIYVNGNAATESPLALGAYGETVEMDVHAAFKVFEPEADVFPTSLDFGEAMVGSVSSLTVEVANTGTVDLSIESIGLGEGSSADFSVSAQISGITLMPGADYAFDVSYEPLDEGQDGGIVLIRVGGVKMPLITVPLSGRGVTENAP